MMPTRRFADGLPWGWWLHARDGMVEDEGGRRWPDVRAAYWHGHLGFPPSRASGQMQEFLLRALESIDARSTAGAERRQDLYGGHAAFWLFHHCWLASIGLLEMEGRADPVGASLNTKGSAVMLMLRATRRPEWEKAGLHQAATRVPEISVGAGRRALKAFEQRIGPRRHVFIRECIGHSHLVTLTSAATGPRMPARVAIWSLSFADAEVRDGLYAWLAGRVDCWDGWGDLACRMGAGVLTSHLLALVVASTGPADQAREGRQ